MIEQLLMWKVYFSNFINYPINLYVLIFSFILSAVFYLLFKRTESIKKKINFLAIHIVLLFFPFIFAVLSWKCIMPVVSCSVKMFTLFIPFAALGAAILSFMLLPFLYNWSNKSNSINKGFIKNFVENQSMKLKIREPKIYSINEVKPMAYSITNLKPSVFISVGLSELLSKKEMQAVLLHELYHQKSKAYFWKFSFNMLRIFTPLSTFISVSEPMEKEEREADKYAIGIQKTGKYLKSAKRKIEKFNKLRIAF